jgi:HopA1 effector protein family
LSFTRLLERIAVETKVTSPRTVEHARLGVFETRAGVHPLAPADATMSPARTLVYLHYHAGDDEGVRLLRRRASQVVALVEQEDAGFAARLDAANRGSGYFDPGWSVVAAEGGRRRVRRRGLTLTVERRDLRPSSAAPGAACEVRLPKALPYAHRGWYLALGDAGPCRADLGPVTRLYFTVADAETALALTRDLTELLNGCGVPFQVKVMNDPLRFRRRDGFVLYLQADAWQALRPQLESLHAAHRAGLRDDVPGFALRLAPGWSLAEEPLEANGSLSFGQHRAMLVAEGLHRAFDQNEPSPEGRLASIARRFGEAGLDVERPYLDRPAMAVAT